MHRRRRSVRERSSAFLWPADGTGNGASARHSWRTRTPSDVGGTVSANVWWPNRPRTPTANAPERTPRHKRHQPTSNRRPTGPRRQDRNPEAQQPASAPLPSPRLRLYASQPPQHPCPGQRTGAKYRALLAYFGGNTEGTFSCNPSPVGPNNAGPWQLLGWVGRYSGPSGGSFAASSQRVLGQASRGASRISTVAGMAWLPGTGPRRGRPLAGRPERRSGRLRCWLYGVSLS